MDTINTITVPTVGYWYYLHGEHICVTDEACTRDALPATARSVKGPYLARALPLSAADSVARMLVETA